MLHVHRHGVGICGVYTFEVAETKVKRGTLAGRRVRIVDRDIRRRRLLFTKRLEDRKMHVELTDRAKDLLIAEGYDPIYGARPLKRAIQRRVLDPLAMRVLQGEFHEGDTIRIDVVGGDLQFVRSAHGVAA